MDNINPIPEIVGETTDVETWLIRAGLRFSDLGDDAGSKAIRKQWREYQTAVHRCCVMLHKPPSKVQLSGDYARLRIPNSLVGQGGGGAEEAGGRRQEAEGRRQRAEGRREELFGENS
ncbi:MAG: hypothetical protein RMX96_11745 [Nostoc sp. ChiSLP02]|nr:hypothetical protein [Nostoc sp. DedSLP05]MDZ8103507.1 hypothetical protein [Nostoc sp. DedSLP01]MDZ8185513.1 hypothetical protein [Nostoc sp. ChiSLP02]